MKRFDNWKQELGTRVIVRSNEDEPLEVGDLIDFYALPGNEFPLVRIGEKELVCMGIVVPYSEELHTMLSAMPPKHQWNVMRGISLAIQIKHRRAE